MITGEKLMEIITDLLLDYLIIAQVSHLLSQHFNLIFHVQLKTIHDYKTT